MVLLLLECECSWHIYPLRAEGIWCSIDRRCQETDAIPVCPLDSPSDHPIHVSTRHGSLASEVAMDPHQASLISHIGKENLDKGCVVTADSYG